MDKRISGLDLLKIIATVMIIFHHYQQITGAWWGASSFYGGLFYYGELVELFLLFLDLLCIDILKNKIRIEL